MSDPGRKSFTQKTEETIKPDSQKSVFEKGKEYVTEGVDKLAGVFQPEKDKGVLQGAHDSAKEGEGKANAERTGESLGQKKDEFIDTAKQRINEASEYASNKAHGGSGAGTEASRNDPAI